MFTGIVETIGRIAQIERHDDSIRLRVDAPDIMTDAHHGDSIAVNGVCLTITEFDERGFWADVMDVTLAYTTLGAVSEGDSVNIERAMSPSSRYGGHIVQGHMDGTATLISRTRSTHWEVFRFRSDDPDLDKYIAKKGSVALNGTSLTVAEVGVDVGVEDRGERRVGWFEVSLIPTTLSDTMLGQLAPGDRVNLECDVIAKYLERLQSHTRDTQGDR